MAANLASTGPELSEAIIQQGRTRAKGSIEDTGASSVTEKLKLRKSIRRKACAFVGYKKFLSEDKDGGPLGNPSNILEGYASLFDRL